jgi:CheY-like chemotaxis protein
MNGVEAAAAIRQHDLVHGRSDNPRILGLTGNAASEDVAQFQRAGCDDVLTKPLRLDYFKSLLISYGLHPTPQT